MKRVQCINNKGCNISLTYGKFYDVYEAGSNGFYIKDDRRMMKWYTKEKFNDYNESFESLNEKVKEYSLIEILDEEYVGKKFKIIGEEQVYIVAEGREDIFLQNDENWGASKIASKKLLNSKYIQVEYFKGGDIVQNKKTMKIYVVESVYKDVVTCNLGSYESYTFHQEEIIKVPDETVINLKNIFAPKTTSYKTPF